MSKDEFVKIDLKVATAYPVVGTYEPLLEVADGAIGEWNGRRRALAEFDS